MDVIGLVLQLALQKGLGAEVRQRDFFLPQDGPGALRPVAHQLLGPGVHRTGDQVEDQLALGLQGPHPFQAAQQDQGIAHVLARELAPALHLLPGLQEQLDGIAAVQRLPREGDTGGADRAHRLSEAVPDHGRVPEGQHLAVLVQAVSAGSTADLVDLGGGHGPEGLSVELLGLGKDDPLDRQRDAEADRVGRHDDVRLARGVLAHLAAARLRRQRAVDHAGPEAVFLQQGRRGQHALARKADQRVVRPEVLIPPAGARVAQRGEAFVPHHAVLIRKALDQGPDIAQGLRRHADVHDVRVHQADRLQPGGAAARVRDELGLVDDGGLKAGLKIAELDGGRDDHRPLHRDGLLTGQHAAGDAVGVDPVIHLQRQQAQRSQIGPGRVPLQILDRVMGLAAVGGADVQHETAPQLPRALDIGLRRIGGEHGADLLDLLLQLAGVSALLHGVGDLRMRQHLLDLVLRPDANVPVSAVLRPDPLQTGLREIPVDLVLRHAVAPDDLLLIQEFRILFRILFLF